MVDEDEMRVKMEALLFFVFFFQAEDGIRDRTVTGVQTCALPILEPDNAQLTLQQYGAECETGDRAALGVDRHGIDQTADEPRKHVARYDDAPSSPVSSRQARITQNSAKGGRIKVAGVIRREYELGVFRETIEAHGFDPEEPAHNGSIGKKQNARYQPHHETGRFQPALLLVRQDLLWTIERLGF